MKQKHLFLTLSSIFILYVSGFGQTRPKDPNEAADRMIKEIKLPSSKVIGKRYLEGNYTFVVELDGSISNVEVKDSIGHGTFRFSLAEKLM